MSAYIAFRFASIWAFCCFCLTSTRRVASIYSNSFLFCSNCLYYIYCILSRLFNSSSASSSLAWSAATFYCAVLVGDGDVEAILVLAFYLNFSSKSSSEIKLFAVWLTRLGGYIGIYSIYARAAFVFWLTKFLEDLKDVFYCFYMEVKGLFFFFPVMCGLMYPLSLLVLSITLRFPAILLLTPW